MKLRALTWNLYHGRDRSPDPALHTWRSRLLRVSERNETHLQVNRDLFKQFAGVLAGADWELALLQECPPRWAEPLARGCRAEGHRSLTSRNSLAPLRSVLARLNPDLIASNEGGSNLSLIRGGEIRARRELVLCPGPRPERRVMAFLIASFANSEIAVANLHASAGAALRPLAEREVLAAASAARSWAGDRPLLLGGDLNVRPRDSTLYRELAAGHGLAGPTAASSLDHLLAAGLETVTPPTAWAAERREVRIGGRAVRLSDHAPVAAEYELRAASSHGLVSTRPE